MTGLLRTFLVVACGLWLACVAAPADARTEPVLQAQERLEALGLSPGPIDGLMGERTREALRAFQRRSGLPATGELDWQTRIALAAGVRTPDRGPAAPVPRPAPVPAVTISPLPSPEPATPGDDGRRRETTEVGQDVLGMPDPIATVRPETEAGTAEPPATRPVASGGDPGGLRRAVPAILLGLAAAGAWAGLLLWWLRQRRRAGD